MGAVKKAVKKANQKTDTLYQIFERYLHDVERVQCEQDLVYEVVGDYIFQLNQAGHTPDPHIDDIEDLIRDEVLEMLRKKIYGFRTITEYRKSLLSQCH